ncbi:hypothetical protein WME98_13425 [Sorangium sp. So ce296]|uniref:hypothetical protein n=1 Tax=Sorangium sp. So ce296 TaxID=3133296 RepID=UPI003F60C475
MTRWLDFLSLMTAAGCLSVACTGNIGPVGGIAAGGEGGAGSAAGPGGNAPTATTDATTITTASGGAGGAASVGGAGGMDCGGSPDDDADGDGYTEQQGDCDDCNPLVNPGVVELATVGGEGGAAPERVDDDCDGEIDNLPEPCDDDIPIDDADPLKAAKAVELCKTSSGPGDWGVVSAAWVMVDGSPPPEGAEQNANFHLGHGILPKFGANIPPKAGARLLALSSGTARQASDEGFESPMGFNKKYEGEFPEGFPKDPRDCGDFVPLKPSDPTAVEIAIRVPTNVRGFAFNINYVTYDWPLACTEFNDYFVALLSPRPANLIDGHILFDNKRNAMSINNAFIDVCSCDGGPPCNLDGRVYACSSGTSELLGTGFEGRAGTGWLVTSAPVEPGQLIKIRWGAYDAGDHQLDSTGLVDNWVWLAEKDETVSTVPVDRPPPAP